MNTAPLTTHDARDCTADAPLIVEGLLCQIEDLRAADGDPAAIADLWARLDLLQGR